MAVSSPFAVFQRVFNLKLDAEIPAAEFAPADDANPGKLLVTFFPNEPAVVITGNDRATDTRVFLKLHLGGDHTLVEFTHNGRAGEPKRCNNWVYVADCVSKLQQQHAGGALERPLQYYKTFLWQLAGNHRDAPYELVREMALEPQR